MSIIHGISINETSDTSGAITVTSTAVIGIVATADDADNSTFPLDTPILISDLTAAIGKSGKTGTLHKALIAINANVSAPVIVVRVADNKDTDALNASVIGLYDGKRTGIQALLSAEAATGLRPTIIGAPDLDTQPVVTALIPIAKQLRAMIYASAVGNTVADAIKYRANFDARELMLVWPNVIAYDSVNAKNDVFSSAAFALGQRAAIDESIGFNKTVSNVAISGILGLEHPISFDLTSMNSDAGLLNQSQITTVIRHNGFRFWGNRAATSDDDYTFESATRTHYTIIESIISGSEWAIDQPLTTALIQTIVDEINNLFRTLKLKNQIIGAKCWYDTDKNSAANLAAGQLYLSYNFTPTAPNENLNITATITDTYYASMNSSLSSSTGTGE
ncbi:phage tail sheath subtilisin-like domain-containing protein [Zymomonas mobilis]|uniref:phage tail sheath subtilisin-like domain-containing protein n=1 Tax=Zymomonas mobilis TaxID=542 RepID=UPI0021C405C7|nr:phage tail sheath subtilisin-like domain-containing protein [Zymomonas mobilis]MCP9308663.1 phage tail sheath subtilisin-like domain-containing protein [Zymomonas mobilis]